MEGKRYWYGIYPIRFIWHGPWSDPELSAHGVTVNVHDIEDYLWDIFNGEMEEKGISFEKDNDLYTAFEKWMLDNKDYVKETFKDSFVDNAANY